MDLQHQNCTKKSFLLLTQPVINQISQQFLEITLPPNMRLTEKTFKEIDYQVSTSTQSSCKLILQFDSISSFSHNTQRYLESEVHQSRYKAIAIVSLANKEMKILDHHYLKQIFDPLASYQVQICHSKTAAEQWLALQ